MKSADDPASQIDKLEQRLVALDREREVVVAQLEQLNRTQPTSRNKTEQLAPEPLKAPAPVTMASGTSDKIALFRDLFRGREDVFPRRWQNTKTGRSGYSPVCNIEWARGLCKKPEIKCGECPNQAFVPVSDDVIRDHLQGGRHGSTSRQSGLDFIAGVYPLLLDETCWFLAADFDKESWERDATAFLGTCHEREVPAVIERSRSGNGAHVWIFFAEPVPVFEARRLGALLMTATMERHPDIGFDSYDRFFPSQDTMPAGGFGNLIALPFQNGPRRAGNSVFIDEHLHVYEDQWAFLATIERMSRNAVSTQVATAEASGRILGVRLPVDDENEEPWTAPPSRRRPEPPIEGNLPQQIKLVLGNQIYIDRRGLPAGMVNRFVRLAAVQNPEFYATQAMRLSTFGKPRIISCAQLFPNHIALPRGCLDAVLNQLSEYKVRAEIQDERNTGTEQAVCFLGQLTDEQEASTNALLEHDIGVLAAATAFGKTVVAARIIAARRRNTLVLVHRRQLLDQWVARLGAFLDVEPRQIGVIGGGKRKPTGVIDVALIQSLVRKGEVSDLVADYGHVIVDECHHLPAVSFEAAAREFKAKFVLGLSATVARKDGHHPIIFMQCGAVRYRVDARKHAAERPFAHSVVFRQTAFCRPQAETEERPSIQNLYGLIARDEARNDLIFDDVVSAIEAGKSPVVITERKDHVLELADRLSRFVKNVIVLRGGMGAREHRRAIEVVTNVPDDEERVLVATGRYLGEGFDDARLDTLFLAMPISWRGVLAQYAGRLHRLHPAKREVVIYDYVDSKEPMLAKMAAKRRPGYRNLGYTEVPAEDLFTRTVET